MEIDKITKKDYLDNIEREFKEVEEIKGVLNFREATPEEKENLDKRIPEKQKKALKICAETFNKECDYPWYITGSIAFLITAKKSEKQPDDIDIIFHEKDFAKISKKFQENWGFEIGQADETNCNYIKGEINNVKIEAFGQKTKGEPNGLVNPGAQNTEYTIIKNYLEETEFNSLDRESQIELYFKNLISEIKSFNLETTLEKEEKEIIHDSIKFISRIGNLFELNNNDNQEIIMKIKNLCENDPQKKKILREFLNISHEFKSKKKENEGQGLSLYFNDGKLQPSIEKLKEEISITSAKIVKDYKKIEKMLKEEQESSIIKKEIENTINKNKDLINEYLNLYKEINVSDKDYKDLPLYIFINRFNENYIIPFCQKLEKINQEL